MLCTPGSLLSSLLCNLPTCEMGLTPNLLSLWEAARLRGDINGRDIYITQFTHQKVAYLG